MDGRDDLERIAGLGQSRGRRCTRWVAPCSTSPRVRRPSSLGHIPLATSCARSRLPAPLRRSSPSTCRRSAPVVLVLGRCSGCGTCCRPQPRRRQPRVRGSSLGTGRPASSVVWRSRSCGTFLLGSVAVLPALPLGQHPRPDHRPRRQQHRRVRVRVPVRRRRDLHRRRHSLSAFTRAPAACRRPVPLALASHRAGERGPSLLTVDRPIGMFDSGFGGLTVARAVIDLLPGRGPRVHRRHGSLPVRTASGRRGAPLRPGAGHQPRRRSRRQGDHRRLQHRRRIRTRRACATSSPCRSSTSSHPAPRRSSRRPRAVGPP